MERRLITGFGTTPCPRNGSTYVGLAPVGRDKSRLTCDCGATTTVDTPRGEVDVPTLNRLLAACSAMHATDPSDRGGA